MLSDVSLLDLGEMFGRTATGVRRVGAAMRRDRRSAMTVIPAMTRGGELFAVTRARFAAGRVAGTASLIRRDRVLRFAFGRGRSCRTGSEQGDRFGAQMRQFRKLEDGRRRYGQNTGRVSRRKQPIAGPKKLAADRLAAISSFRSNRNRPPISIAA